MEVFKLTPRTTRRAASALAAAALLAAPGWAGAAEGTDGLTYKPGGGLRYASPDGTFTFAGKGIITLDAGLFDGGDPPVDNDVKARDAIIDLSGRIAQDFRYWFTYDFTDNTGLPFRPYKNITLTYTGFDPVTVTVGNQKVPFSRQHLSEPPMLVFHERALPFALAPRRRVGVSLGVSGARWQASGGVFGTNVNDDVDFDDRAYGLRATYAPKLGPRQTLHLGAGVNYVTPDPQRAAFGAPPETLLPRRPLVASGPIAGADSFWRGNLELGGIFGPLSVQGEYHRVGVDAAGGTDPTFHGGYLQAAWLLTGESRQYVVAKNHMFRGMMWRPKVENPVDLTDPLGGGSGAWEIAARVSASDLRDAGVGGGDQRGVTVGLNWFLNGMLRASVNYLRSETDEAGAPDETLDAGLFRLQLLL